MSIRWLLALPFRLVALLFAGLAALALAHDIWRSVSGSALVTTPLGELWFAVSADTLNLMQAAIQRGVHPALWDPGFVFFLQRPAWLSLFVFAALALLLARLIYRPRRRN